jgi:ComF family protein
VKSLVGDYKYESIRESAKVMALLLDLRVAVLPGDTIVTAVPTIHSHIRRRGFDHAALLAREFSALRNIPYFPLLKRVHQQTQHDLKRTARLQAAKQAFGVKNIPKRRPVLLIDDIMTTGATLEACVRLLQDGGVNEVYVAVVARQMPR